MPNQLSIFTEFGTVSDDIDPAEVEKLSEQEKHVLGDCLAHCRAAQAGEARVNELRLSVRDHQERYNAALEADQAANPPMTNVQAWEMARAATNPHIPKSKLKKPNAKTKAALDQAGFELAQTQDNFQRAINSQRGLDKSRATAIVAWVSTQAQITFDDIHRETVARSNADRLARVERGEPADFSLAAKVTHVSQLDRDYAARGAVKKKPAYLGTNKKF